MSTDVTSRRTFLTRATAVPAALAAGSAPALASTESPIVRLFREWEALMDLANRRGLTDEEGDALDQQRGPIQAALLAEPATDLRDLAIKVLVDSGEGTFGLQNMLTLECATLAGRDFAKLPRCLFKEEPQ